MLALDEAVKERLVGLIRKAGPTTVSEPPPSRIYVSVVMLPMVKTGAKIRVEEAKTVSQ